MFQAGVKGKVEIPIKPRRVIHIENLVLTDERKINPPENTIANDQDKLASAWARKVAAITIALIPKIKACRPSSSSCANIQTPPDSRDTNPVKPNRITHKFVGNPTFSNAEATRTRKTNTIVAETKVNTVP